MGRRCPHELASLTPRGVGCGTAGMTWARSTSRAQLLLYARCLVHQQVHKLLMQQNQVLLPPSPLTGRTLQHQSSGGRLAAPPRARTATHRLARLRAIARMSAVHAKAQTPR